jgi:polysaccharide pyruvyl transferase WcaK-like protein
MRRASLSASRLAARSSISKSRPRIAVVANAGNTNLGDEAVLASTVAVLRARLVDPDIRVYSLNPADTAARHRVKASPLRSRVTALHPVHRSVARSDSMRAIVREIPVVAPIVRAAFRLLRIARGAARELAFIVSSLRRLRGTHLLVIAGSNQLEDWFGGPWGYPYTTLLWTVLARIVGAPVALVSVGAGPLRSGLSRWMCVQALRLASYRSFRDAESLELMRRLGYHGPGTVVPDLAFALVLETPLARPAGMPRRLAINLFPYRDPQYDPTVADDGAGFAEYVDAIAQLVANAHARGLEPVLVGSQRADKRALDLVEERTRALAPHIGDIERHMPATLADLVGVIDGCDLVVATRYHGILLAVLRGRPTIGICYQSKSRRLLEMAGLGESAVDAEGLDSRAILDELTKATASGTPDDQIYARAMTMHIECQRGFKEALERCLPGLVMSTAVE